MVPRSLIELVLPAPRLPRRTEAARRAGIVSVLLHMGVVTSVLFMATRSAPVATPPDAASSRQPIQLPHVVFLQMPGPSGGGGGGGTRQAAPPSRSDANGRDRLNVPLATPVAASQQSLEAPCPPQELLLDAVPLASGTALLAGLPDARPSLDISKGPGLGGGIGEGTGTGIGAGTGAGVGPGLSRGFGDGAYRPGGGVVPPTLLKQVRPNYTTEALRLRIQGSVLLELVVGRDGIPLAIRITRSLDPGGLDEEAVAAVREWRFAPGHVGDMPVDVLVTIQLDFHVQ
jgi:protein TonB